MTEFPDRAFWLDFLASLQEKHRPVPNVNI
jgi:hypothetical protein